MRSASSNAVLRTVVTSAYGVSPGRPGVTRTDVTEVALARLVDPTIAIVCDCLFVESGLPITDWSEWSLDHSTFDEFVAAIERGAEEVCSQQPVRAAIAREKMLAGRRDLGRGEEKTAKPAERAGVREAPAELRRSATGAEPPRLLRGRFSRGRRGAAGALRSR